MNSISLLTYRISFSAGLVFSILFLPFVALAQEADTTKKELDFNERELFLRQQFDRVMTGGVMTEMGIYQVPQETRYYVPPFKGQYYLDMAVEAYRRELEKRIGPDWLYQFLRTISPYVNNQFEFGVYQKYDIPIVDRDNPLFQSDQ